MTTQTPTERLLSVRQVADELGVSRGFLYAQIRRGELDAIQIGRGQRRGRVLRIHPDDLVAYLRSVNQP